MKIQILETTVAARRIVRPGEVIDIEDTDAKYLIAVKKAKLAAAEVDVPVLPVGQPEPKRNKKKEQT